MEITTPAKRCFYLDAARIFALFSMVLLHVSSLDWQTAPVTSSYWQTLNAYNSSVGYCISLFVMISGAIWLSRSTIDLKRLYTHNLLRIVTAFLFWSLLYALLHSFGRDLLYRVPFDSLTINDFLRQWICGRYHLWFCFMIAGLYVLLPLIKAITDNRSLLRYFILVGFVFTILLPSLQSIPALSKLSVLTEKMHMSFFGGYTFYFVLGYFLSVTELPKPTVYIVYACGVAATVYLVLYTGQVALLTGNGANIAPLWALCNLAQLSALFLFFRNVVGRAALSAKAKDVLATLAGLCFGAYLIHDFFLWAINKVLPVSAFAPALSVPLLAIVETGLSLCAAWLVRRIPRIGKYIS